MEASVMLGLIFLTLAVYWRLPRRLQAAECFILLFASSVLVISWSTVISLNFQLLITSLHPGRFIAFFIYRSFLIPVVLMVFTDIALNVSGFPAKITATAATVLVLTGLYGLSVLLGTSAPVQWNGWLAALTNLGYFLFSWMIGRIITRRESAEGSNP
ncbi:hypothetical protein LJK87_32455 [Paenibacillus sp. P25]|nr:hypothetical protein LJK87_32455 [Paenibacillus sp. P25]